MTVQFKIDLRPHRIKCPDCDYVAERFNLLVLHWSKAWKRPEIWGKHYKAAQRADSPLRYRLVSLLRNPSL